MAFRASKMKTISSNGRGRLWYYETIDDVTTPNYFLSFAANFKVGSRLYVTVVNSSGAYVSSAKYVVTNSSGAVVAVVGWALDAAVTPVTTWTAVTGGIGRETIPTGNWPNATDGTWVGSVSAHGPSGFSTTLSGIWIGSFTALTAAVDAAELRFSIATMSGGDGFPVNIRWRAVKSTSPPLPVTTTGEMSEYYSGGSGWTTAYTDVSVATTGVTRVDITDIVNELVSSLGTTGTSILMVAEFRDPLTDARVFNFSTVASYAARILVYPSLNHRDYQTKQISGGSAVFYWPLDATDVASSDFRSLVAPSAGSAGVAVQDTIISIPGAVTPAVPSKYGRQFTNFPSELDVFGWITRFLGPLVADNGNIHDNTYGWTYTTSANDFLMVFQFARNVASARPSLLYDSLSDLGFTTKYTEVVVPGTTSGIPGTDVFIGASWAGDTPPYIGVNPVGGLNTATSAVVTIVWHYDNIGNRWNLGYNNSDGTGWHWDSTLTDTGAPATNINGILLSTGLAVLQGWAAFEFTTEPTFSTIKMACERMRALWADGVKSLPPILYT